jgi:hypothetical protein
VRGRKFAVSPARSSRDLGVIWGLILLGFRQQPARGCFGREGVCHVSGA